MHILVAREQTSHMRHLGPSPSLPACTGSQMLSVPLQPCPLWHQGNDLMSWDVPYTLSFWARLHSPPVSDLLLSSPLRDHDNVTALVLCISSTQTSPFLQLQEQRQLIAEPQRTYCQPTNTNYWPSCLKTCGCSETNRIMYLSSALKSRGCKVLFFSELFINSRENGKPQM